MPILHPPIQKNKSWIHRKQQACFHFHFPVQKLFSNVMEPTQLQWYSYLQSISHNFTIFMPWRIWPSEFSVKLAKNLSASLEGSLASVPASTEEELQPEYDKTRYTYLVMMPYYRCWDIHMNILIDLMLKSRWQKLKFLSAYHSRLFKYMQNTKACLTQRWYIQKISTG